MKTLLVISAMLFLVGCRHMMKSPEQKRFEWQKEEWIEAVEYAIDYSASTKCIDFYKLVARFPPNYTYDEKAQLAGAYYEDGHEIIYRDKRVLFHESLHTLNRLAPRKCESELASAGADEVRRLQKELRYYRLHNRQ